MSTNEVISLIIALSGWVVAILQVVTGYYERKTKQDDHIFLKTVDYFSGGSQKRSVGISLIEGLIKKKKRYSEIIVPLLSNQFVYLLLSTDTKSAAHEERNLVRIFSLVESIIKEDRQAHSNSRNEVLNAIVTRLDQGVQSTLNISPETLKAWKEALGK